MGKAKDSSRSYLSTAEPKSNLFLEEKNIIKCELNPEMLKTMRAIFDEKLSADIFRKGDLNAICKIYSSRNVELSLRRYDIPLILYH